MPYPLISEYKEAILSAEDNFNELTSLRPVLDEQGNPVISSGNFAVVFKMKDINDGRFYAVKCFIKDQEGRDESYRKIADELEVISSSFILPLRYLENELFVDSPQCDRNEFPVVVMEWVEGETLDSCVKRNLNDKYELDMLSYRFNRMAAWLLAQPFAHGDLKPDNILVRNDGSLVLVDYDGMFVPSMKGEKAREIGSPDFRHPLRTDADFDEHIDDFSIALIALSLKAIASNPALKTNSNNDSLLFSEADLRDCANSESYMAVQKLIGNPELTLLLGAFNIALAKNNLDMLSFRLFMTAKPTRPTVVNAPSIEIDTSVTAEEIKNGVTDEYGVIYSKDFTKLLYCNSILGLEEYTVKSGTVVICNDAFYYYSSLQVVNIPNSVTAIGNSAFSSCSSLLSVDIPDSVTAIGNSAFSSCSSLQIVKIPNSVKAIGNSAFSGCSSLQSINIPDSVTAIGDSAFQFCSSLQSVNIPNSVTAIGDSVFQFCSLLQTVNIPNSVTTIGSSTFYSCSSLQTVNIPNSVTAIGDHAFSGCSSLQSVNIPNSVKYIGDHAFSRCSSLQKVNIPNSVQIIGNGAFSGAHDVHILNSSSHFKVINGLLIDVQGCLISCLKDTEVINIPKWITTIKNGAFFYCKSLQSVNIPDSVTAIGDSAFFSCSSLQSVNIPSSVTAIGNSAFGYCCSLRFMNIPNSVMSIGDFTFSNCTSLHSVNIPNSVISIGNHAFLRCSSLQKVNIPTSLRSISENAFEGCILLSKKEFPNWTHLIF